MTWLKASSTALPPADRFEWFLETLARELMPTAVSTTDRAAFRAEAAVLDLGAVQLSRYSHSPLLSRRTPALIRKGDPEQYQLGLVTRNRMWISQRQNDSGFISGDMVLWDSSRPFEAGAQTDGDTVRAIVVQVPKSELPLRTDRVDRILGQRIPAGEGMAAILAQFLTSVAQQGEHCRPSELARLGQVALDLTAACLAQQLDVPEDLPAETRTRALREQVDAFTERNLGDPELTPRAIAAHHNVSLRSPYALYEGEEGIAASVRRRRLERCRADLARPDVQHEPVQAVAARWGFSSATVFSRAFRAPFGTTPTEYRRQALESRAARTGRAAGVEGAARNVEKPCTPCTPPPQARP